MNPSLPTLLEDIYADADAALAEHLDLFEVSTRTASPCERDALLRSTALSLVRRLSVLATRVGATGGPALATELRVWAWTEMTARFSAPAHVELIERALSTLGPRQSSTSPVEPLGWPFDYVRPMPRAEDPDVAFASASIGVCRAPARSSTPPGAPL